MKRLESLARDKSKNLLENISRHFNKGNIFVINDTKFFLPIRGDHISREIILKRNFYGFAQLDKLSNILNQNIGVVLDIGANIGNHTLFFCKKLNAKKVYSFEPRRDIYSILEKNIKINNLDEIVKPFNIGIGSSNTIGNINSSDPNNSGHSIMKVGAKYDKNDIQIKTLDSINIPEKVDLIKIDVESFELDVLKGAKKTILRDSPLLFIEINYKNLIEINKLLFSYGYVFLTMLDGDYLFIKRECPNDES